MDLRAFENEVLTSLKEEMSCYQSLLDLTEKEKKIVGSVKNNSMQFSIFNKKDKIVKQINELDNKSQPMKKTWLKNREYLSKKSVNTAEGLLEKMKATIERVLVIEKEIEDLVSTELENIKNELKTMANQRETFNGYNNRGVSLPKFMDIKG